MVQHVIIGSWRGVAIEVAAWDGVAAEVDLSCACMFSHEVQGDAPKGGLAHLDEALGHAVTELRRDGYFHADEMETLLISRPPVGIAADRVLIIGLGAPSPWTPPVMGRAVAAAYRSAIQQQMGSVAFAPSMLDGGLDPSMTGDVASAMLKGLADAIDAQTRLAELGLVAPPSLVRWVFDVGAARFQAAADRFRSTLEAL
jgi:hypothetical protein